jgi:ribosome-associated protein
LDSKEKVRRIVSAALDKKGIDPVVLYTQELTSLADYIVIVSGTSDRHVRSIASGIDEALRAMKERPIGIEGEAEGRWVLVDGADVIAHVFYEPVREFYDIERLWMDAPRFIPNPAGTELEPSASAPKARIRR